ncbi:hypothetical protein P8936_14630 [Edaphobacter paludis]|uniref:DUF2384 domain-containing protein n=1 Tax=Edaphobacter paludis TaxID=3035702 RepID=A0AAU7D6P9_9BACT
MSSNPVLRHMPVPLLDRHSWKVRKEHSPAGVRVFFNIMEEWNVGPEDAPLLLGVSSRYYNQLKARQEGQILNTDRLYRMSYLVGIYKALRLLHGPTLENRFVYMSNTNRLFAGKTPLSYMIQGGQPAMQRVRRLLDARAAGN